MASLVWTHGLAALLKHIGSGDPASVAMALSLAAIATGLASFMFAPKRWGSAAVFGVGALAATAVYGVDGSVGAAAAAVPIAGCLAHVLSIALLRALPAWIDDYARTYRLGRIVWILLALASIAQTTRLANHITDPETPWFLATSNPFWTKHECLPAYVFGAELNARGETNVYDAKHYPALNASAEPITAMLGMAAEDPFQYPPPFLLLPRAAIALTHDYATIRSVWFAVQASVFFLVAVILSLWVGERAGRWGLLGIPLAYLSFPVLISLQYGQFHLMVIALSMLGMVAVSSKRDALGGVLLAVAILAKLFPALLLIPLVIRRQWGALAWTAVAGSVFCGLALWIVGWPAFEAFFTYHLPRLQSGETFAFAEAWPELGDIIMADNQGVAGLVGKLRALGVSAMTPEVGRWLTKIAQLAIVMIVALGTIRIERFEADRGARALFWFGILGLGSLTSPGAFGDYVPLAATWMLTLLVPWIAGNARRTCGIGIVWVFQFFLVGTMPLGTYAPPKLMAVLSGLGALMMLGLFAWASYGGFVLGRKENSGSTCGPADGVG